jgi:outer membrane protein assembly complex protein YaeT
MRRFAAHICASLFLFTLIGTSIVRADVTDYLGKVVTSVALQSEGRTVTDTRLSSLVETPVGRPLAMRQVRESVAHLFSLAQYEDVRVHAELVGDGVRLVYELVPMHPVERIEFEGTSAPGIDDDELRRALTERFGPAPRAARRAEMATAVEGVLGDAGYLRARVTARAAVEHEPERTTLIFAVQPGPRTRIGSVSMEGDAGMPTEDLVSRLGIRAGEPYERARIDQRVQRYIEDRRRKGFYEARLTLLPTFAEDNQVVTLRVAVVQGPLVRVVFTGDAIPASQREELVPIARESSVDEDLLEDSSNRIEEYLRSQGYRDASAPHTRDERDGELIVGFDVRRGPQYRVQAIDIAGNTHLSDDFLGSRLRVRAGQPFSGAALDSDLTRIDDTYRQLGFTSAKADAQTQVAAPAPDGHVPVGIRIEIVEGTQTIVNSVRVDGNQAVAEGDLLGGLSLAPGQPFSVGRLAQDRDAIELKYANLGYQNVTVETRPELRDDGTRADVVFTVREGPRVFVDHVLIVGNTRTKTATIERELRFKPGDPLGLEAISESQRRLAALGLFRRARILQLGNGDAVQRDVLVTVEEAPLTTLGYGGGFEVRSRVVRAENDPTVASEKLEFAPRASFEIGRRNLFGTNRSVNLFTSASLHPRDSPVFANQEPTPGTDASGGYGFPEYRVLGQFRQPRLLSSAADFRVTGTLEQQIRSSFNFSRRSMAAEIAFRLPRSSSASLGYQIQRTRVFNQSVEESQQRDIDRLFPKVRLSSFVGSIIRDTRDDPVDPADGQYFSANGQVAARAIGSEVGFVKSFFTAQTFKTLPGRRAIVFAASARLGAAGGFPSAAGSRDLPASERFFAGGDTTVRGFALDRLGVRHDPSRPTDTIDAAGFPLGGNALLLLNGELRVPVRNGVKLVGFADVGNVFKSMGDVAFGELRPALGLGFRYRSPVGPIRFDLGFKVPKHPGETRAQWFITFGEAF